MLKNRVSFSPKKKRNDFPNNPIASSKSLPLVVCFAQRRCDSKLNFVCSYFVMVSSVLRGNVKSKMEFEPLRERETEEYNISVNIFFNIFYLLTGAQSLF